MILLRRFALVPLQVSLKWASVLLFQNNLIFLYDSQIHINFHLIKVTNLREIMLVIQISVPVAQLVQHWVGSTNGMGLTTREHTHILLKCLALNAM